MDTKGKIILEASRMICEKGYNAFSFKDISILVGVKTSSIHYYFPSKRDLAIAVVAFHSARNDQLKKEWVDICPKKKLEFYLDIHSKIRKENKVSIIGALAADLNTLDDKIKYALGQHIENEIQWLRDILVEGRNAGEFTFDCTPETKALMVLTNILAVSRLSILTQDAYFEQVKEQVFKDINLT